MLRYARALPTWTIVPRSRGSMRRERRHRPVHEAEVVDGGHPFELFGLEVRERREDRRHRVVDPDVDRPELELDAVGGGFERCSQPATSVGIASDDATGGLDVVRRRVEAVAPAREQRDAVAPRAEVRRDGAAESGAGSGHDDDSLTHCGSSCRDRWGVGAYTRNGAASGLFERESQCPGRAEVGATARRRLGRARRRRAGGRRGRGRGSTRGGGGSATDAGRVRRGATARSARRSRARARRRPRRRAAIR